MTVFLSFVPLPPRRRLSGLFGDGGAMTVVRLDTRRITDWDTFHGVFVEVFGFPNFYGRNMNAWIDCMTSLDDPGAGMTSVHAPSGGVLALQLEFVDDFARRLPELYAAVVECAAFVNWRRIEVGEAPVFALSFNKNAEPSAAADRGFHRAL